MYFESKKSGGEFNDVLKSEKEKKATACKRFKESYKKFFNLKAVKTRGGNN